VLVSVAALAAAQSEVSSFKGVGHTAGRYAERFHYKRPEYESQYESGYQPFQGVYDFSDSILFVLNSLVRAGLFGFIWRHKYQILMQRDYVFLNSKFQQG
jgi:hypothetical protein